MNNAIVKRYPLANSFPILLIACLILEQGYGLLPTPRYLFPVLVGMFFFFFKKRTSYSKPISIFVVSCILSIFSCMYFRYESPVSIMAEYNIYFMIVFYFVLCQIQRKYRSSRKGVVLGLLSLILPMLLISSFSLSQTCISK